MSDLLAVISGQITEEEYVSRRIQSQTPERWLSDYEQAIKNPPELQLNVAGLNALQG